MGDTDSILFFPFLIKLAKNVQGDFQRIEFIIHRNISRASIFNAVHEMLELQLERIIFVDKNTFDQRFLLIPQRTFAHLMLRR